MDRQIGGYVLEEKLGEGGMGAVFRARHPSAPGRPVALKVLRSSSGAPPSAGAVARFQREMLALARVQHPNVVRILGGSLEPPVPFYAMELVAGDPLDVIVARGPLEPRRAVGLVREVADAIAAAHAQGVLHRDLKPSNVLVDATGRPRVCDFGVALVDEGQRLTQTGTFVGSIGYAAPEQLAGEAHRADERTDVYGLGAVLWATLVGRGPFDDRLDAGQPRLLGERAEPPSRHARVPRELDAVVLRALEELPARRYPSAAALRDELDRWLRGEPVMAFESSGLRRAAQSVRSSGWARAIALVAIASLVGAVAVLGAQRGLGARRIAALIADAQAPGARSADLRAALEGLERERAPAEELSRVRERLAERELDDLLGAAAVKGRAGDPPPVAALEAAAAAAERATGRVSLVGERAGLALGDALLDARDELAPARGVAAVGSVSGSLLERALALARARLAGRAGDPAGRALRAYATLARIGAPRRPLGPGALGLEAATSSEVLADLEASRELPGAAGARAAWLLVDLLLAAPGRDGLDHALDVARARFPDAPARASLETAFATPGTAEGFSTLLHDAATPAGAQAAAWTLSRFFARLGAPDAVEHPDVAFDSRALERVFAAEPIPVEPPVDLGTPAGEAIAEFGRVRTEATGQTLDVRGAKLFPIVKRALERDVRHPLSLKIAGDPSLGYLSGSVFAVLAASRSTVEVYTVADDFSRGAREGARTVTESGLRVHSRRWDTGTGVAGCEEFDRRLDQDLASDELVAVALAAGLPRADLDRATRAAKALRRIDELEEDPPETPLDRARIALPALLGMEELARMSPAAAWLFRARLRAVALPPPLGPALARLDLARFERALRVAARAPSAYLNADRLGLIAFQAAKVAGAVHDSALEHPFFDLGVHLCKESAIRGGLEQLEPECVRFAQALAISPIYRGLDIEDPSRRRALVPGPEDHARAGRHYVYWPPRSVEGKPEPLPVPPPRDAVLVSARFPDRLAPGEAAPCEVVVRNAGSLTWSRTGYCLGTRGELEGDAAKFLAWTPDRQRIALPKGDATAPGRLVTFSFDVVAPAEPRTYRLELQMRAAEGDEWFGDTAVGTIVVAPR